MINYKAPYPVKGRVGPQPFSAMTYASIFHQHQKRRYTNDPYFIHLSEVAGIVASSYRADIYYGMPSIDVCLCVAWLHDVVEDQHVPVRAIAEEFGRDVAAGVEWLTDTEVGNRAERKAKARERLASAPSWVQTIKCADIFSNSVGIKTHDPKFFLVYGKEALALIDAMDKADPLIRNWVGANLHASL